MIWFIIWRNVSSVIDNFDKMVASNIIDHKSKKFWGECFVEVCVIIGEHDQKLYKILKQREETYRNMNYGLLNLFALQSKIDSFDRSLAN